MRWLAIIVAMNTAMPTRNPASVLNIHTPRVIYFSCIDTTILIVFGRRKSVKKVLTPCCNFRARLSTSASVHTSRKESDLPAFSLNPTILRKERLMICVPLFCTRSGPPKLVSVYSPFMAISSLVCSDGRNLQQRNASPSFGTHCRPYAAGPSCDPPPWKGPPPRSIGIGSLEPMGHWIEGKPEIEPFLSNFPHKVIECGKPTRTEALLIEVNPLQNRTHILVKVGLCQCRVIGVDRPCHSTMIDGGEEVSHRHILHLCHTHRHIHQSYHE